MVTVFHRAIRKAQPWNKSTLNLLCLGCHQLLWEHFPGAISLPGFSLLSDPYPSSCKESYIWENLWGPQRHWCTLDLQSCDLQKIWMNSQTMYTVIVIIIAQHVSFQLNVLFYCMSSKTGCIAGLVIRGGWEEYRVTKTMLLASKENDYPGGRGVEWREGRGEEGWRTEILQW